MQLLCLREGITRGPWKRSQQVNCSSTVSVFASQRRQMGRSQSDLPLQQSGVGMDGGRVGMKSRDPLAIIHTVGYDPFIKSQLASSD
jgi:hypothetical protein